MGVKCSKGKNYKTKHIQQTTEVSVNETFTGEDGISEADSERKLKGQNSNLKGSVSVENLKC